MEFSDTQNDILLLLHLHISVCIHGILNFALEMSMEMCNKYGFNYSNVKQTSVELTKILSFIG